MSGSRTNGASYHPIDYDPTRPGGPVDMRDIHRLRTVLLDEIRQVDDRLGTVEKAVDRTLTISAATFEAVTGRDVETIPGIGEFARREHRRQTAIRWVAAAFAVVVLSMAGGFLGERLAVTTTTAEHR